MFVEVKVNESLDRQGTMKIFNNFVGLKPS